MNRHPFYIWNSPTDKSRILQHIFLWCASFTAAILLLIPATPIYAASENRQSEPTSFDGPAVEEFFNLELPRLLDEQAIPGAAVAVVQGGELIFAGGYGLADVEAQTPADPYETLFRTGSVGKLFTWYAVMQLVEQGLLDLDADVNTYLDFTIPATYPEPITLRHLLTHTPGFENIGEDLFHLNADERLPLRTYLVRRLPARVYPPGVVGAYSNYGAALAGYIVEQVSGEPFHLYVENHIFQPLGMTRSTLEQPVPPHLAQSLARGYGSSRPFVPGEFIYVSPYPAGASSAPAIDMAHFMAAMLRPEQADGAPILRPETVAQMLAPHYHGDPRLRGATLGWMERRINERDVRYHKGSIVAFHTGLYLLPDENIGVYVAFNGSNAAFVPDPLFYAFLDRFFPHLPESAILADAREDAPTAARFAGEYHAAVADYHSAGKILRMLEAAHVVAGPSGGLAVTVMGETTEYVESEPGLFRSVERGEWLVFQTDADGTRWLLRDGEPHFAFFQPPWYAQAGVTVFTVAGGLLLFGISGLAWAVVGLYQRFSRQKGASGASNLPKHLGPRWLVLLVRSSALAFGLLLAAYILSFISILGNLHPAYGVPMIMFGTPPGETLLWMLPWFSAISAGVMTVGLVFMWIPHRQIARDPAVRWSIGRRLHYTVLTGIALAIMAVLAYWNLWTL